MVALVVLILLYLTGRETCFIPFIKDWKILDHKKKPNEKTKKPVATEKKKIAPKPSFLIKPPSDVHNANVLKRQIQNFFQKKAYSDSDFFRDKKGKKEIIVKATIMRISSKIKLGEEKEKEKENQINERNESKHLRKLLSEVVHCQRMVPQKTRSLNNNQKESHNKLEISEMFSKQIPQEFVMGDNQEEKLLDVLIETQTKE